MPGRVLVTGASGFVGRAVTATLSRAGWDVRATASRAEGGPLAIELGPVADWRGALEGCSSVVHLAARAHVIDGASGRADYLRLNRDATTALARAAADAGVRRFVFMSSVLVHGATAPSLLAETDPPRPESEYALAKWEAEEGLAVLAAETGLEMVSFRPPLVYGPGVKARFLQLIRLVDQGLPLPLGAVRNRRSFIGLTNLADAVQTVLEAPSLPSPAYLVADREIVSTPELLRAIGIALGKPTRLLGLPPALLDVGARAVGKGPEIERLTGSLAVDASRISSELGWNPPRSMPDELADTAAWYRSQR